MWPRRSACKSRGARSCAPRFMPHRVARPRLASLMVVAVFGTTISPYLFFWQASQEAEESRLARQRCATAAHATSRTRSAQPALPAASQLDTWIGMVLLERHRLLHHRHHGGDAARSTASPISRPPRRRPRRCGRSRATRVLAVRARHHRHRPARGAGARGLGRLCGGRDVRAARQPRAAGAAARSASTPSSLRQRSAARRCALPTSIRSRCCSGPP